RAAAPHMHVGQITNKQMSYRVIRGAEDASSSGKTREALARVIECYGGSGLVICPKELREIWQNPVRLPDWELWNFGGIRGRDEAGKVPRLVIVSRQMPSVADTEITAETIFGRAVERLPAGAWYPRVSVGRLMSDGS